MTDRIPSSIPPPASSAQTVSAEEALRRSEARNRAIVEQAVDAILTADATGTILSANRSAERLLGYEPGALVGQPIDCLMPAGASHGAYLSRYLSTMKPHVVGIGREVTGRRRDGVDIPLWLTLSDIDLPGYRIFVAMLRDISAAKETERALRDAKTAIELADRAKTAFLANMSHELRTPLTGILGFADLLRQRMEGRSHDPLLLAGAEEIRRSGELLLANINDLLEIATIEAGCGALEETLVDPAELVASCLRLIAKRAERGRLTVTMTPPGELPPLTADPRALKQALLHLLSNAVKFTPENGMVGVSAGLDAEGDLLIEVRDTGCGITDELMERVFQPFVQGESGLDRAYEGIGLGLSIARSLAERHGGSLAIRSQAGAGTVVTMRLPRTRLLPL
ncbi:sensor histidine kinase [Azospirillum agricola]|uniref:sensor histidine kinase n=1 Tax=Azospirillum agricola TaxID=1720247 RepID=UPI000A0F3C0C|nr:PAS domain-containing sensor histidine kinase [Azospirillum agricola]SMH55770.1 PAS domain S-box-containing protein [Azospirillum lipoferum]